MTTFGTPYCSVSELSLSFSRARSIDTDSFVTEAKRLDSDKTSWLFRLNTAAKRLPRKPAPPVIQILIFVSQGKDLARKGAKKTLRNAAALCAFASLRARSSIATQTCS